MGPRTLSRRELLRTTAGAIAASALPDSSPAAASFSFGGSAVARVPLDFNGLSYESPQLANPAFSADNTALVRLYRELCPTGGVLSTGGNLSGFTGWRNDPSLPLTPAEQAMVDRGKKYWEWDLTDPSIRGGSREISSRPSASQRSPVSPGNRMEAPLRSEFGLGTPAQTAAEAACVQQVIGKNLIAFQLGNEIDFRKSGFRPQTWDFKTYVSEWQQWVATILTTNGTHTLWPAGAS